MSSKMRYTMVDEQMLSVSGVRPGDCSGLGWPYIAAAMLEAATADDEGSGPRQLEQLTSNVGRQDTPRIGSPTQRRQQTRRLSGYPVKRTCIDVE
ncbi:hypothetical protein LSAT2_030572, partial [Lamellibrachia satsuma]